MINSIYINFVLTKEKHIKLIKIDSLSKSPEHKKNISFCERGNDHLNVKCNIFNNMNFKRSHKAPAHLIDIQLKDMFDRG